ncbi:LPS translocon maturation chaperone LptM [Microbulbifer hydrolyticus]|uniref:Small lipoprotein YifL n=1 Tax=Microbulbifer hydrolyticus TaxID=48074 RepID=A0A6P1TI41_9GAMM|nr:lipoprotein [Microbulbifer hydrolyticus]MBB5211927.1 putative small lipoprotein YifL [Microbulbifer hydrolyticus]QHQ40492.1 hypothetical protein GTQ55_16925 [Microbulbifer hydrolyticus]
MRIPTTPLVLSLTLAGALTGCGQKGPLYLPQDPAAPTPSSVPARGASSQPPAATTGQPQTETGEKDQPAQADKNSNRANPEQHTEAEAVFK